MRNRWITEKKDEGKIVYKQIEPEMLELLWMNGHRSMTTNCRVWELMNVLNKSRSSRLSPDFDTQQFNSAIPFNSIAIG